MCSGNLKLLYVVNWENLKQQQITKVAWDKEITWAKVAKTCRSRLYKTSLFANIRRFICIASASFRSWSCWSWDKMLFEFREARESSRGFWNPARQDMHEKGHVNFPGVLHTKNLQVSLTLYILMSWMLQYIQTTCRKRELVPHWSPSFKNENHEQWDCLRDKTPATTCHTLSLCSLVSPCKIITF